MNHDSSSGQSGGKIAMKRLTPDDVARLRRRVEEGYYASVQVSREIARRILEREDI